MILDVSSSCIKVEQNGKVVSLPGEMFFPPNDKLGFVISFDEIQNWDKPYDNIKLTPEEIENVINDIRQDFSKGGHTLEIETN